MMILFLFHYFINNLTGDFWFLPLPSFVDLDSYVILFWDRSYFFFLTY